jgi:hypothetical protein
MNSAQRFRLEIQHSLYWESVISYKGTTPTIATVLLTNNVIDIQCFPATVEGLINAAFEIMIFTSSTHEKYNDPTHARKSSMP